MKATEQYFPLVLCIVTIQVKAIGQYFPVVQYKVVLTFDHVDEILTCDKC